MSGQHCENYDVKRETVHCYPRNVDRCFTWPEVAWCCRGNLIAFFNIFFCFVLLYNKSLNDWPLGEQWICFPRISMFSSTSSRETLRFTAPQRTSEGISVSWDSSDNIRPPLITRNCGHHFAGNSELFPVWRHSFRNVARSWHLAVNSFIVRCHVTMD